MKEKILGNWILQTTLLKSEDKVFCRLLIDGKTAVEVTEDSYLAALEQILIKLSENEVDSLFWDEDCNCD